MIPARQLLTEPDTELIRKIIEQSDNEVWQFFRDFEKKENGK